MPDDDRGRSIGIRIVLSVEQPALRSAAHDALIELVGRARPCNGIEEATDQFEHLLGAVEPGQMVGTLDDRHAGVRHQLGHLLAEARLAKAIVVTPPEQRGRSETPQLAAQRVGQR